MRWGIKWGGGEEMPHHDAARLQVRPKQDLTTSLQAISNLGREARQHPLTLEGEKYIRPRKQQMTLKSSLISFENWIRAHISGSVGQQCKERWHCRRALQKNWCNFQCRTGTKHHIWDFSLLFGVNADDDMVHKSAEYFPLPIPSTGRTVQKQFLISLQNNHTIIPYENRTCD